MNERESYSKPFLRGIQGALAFAMLLPTGLLVEKVLKKDFIESESFEVKKGGYGHDVPLFSESESFSKKVNLIIEGMKLENPNNYTLPESKEAQEWIREKIKKVLLLDVDMEKQNLLSLRALGLISLNDPHFRLEIIKKEVEREDAIISLPQKNWETPFLNTLKENARINSLKNTDKGGVNRYGGSKSEASSFEDLEVDIYALFETKNFKVEFPRDPECVIITVKNFDHLTGKDIFKDLRTRLKPHEGKPIIFNFCGNLGGYVYSSLGLLDVFLGEQKIDTKKSSCFTHEDENDIQLSKNVFILTDQDTASASEFFIETLQAFREEVLTIGDISFGKRTICMPYKFLLGTSTEEDGKQYERSVLFQYSVDSFEKPGESEFTGCIPDVMLDERYLDRFRKMTSEQRSDSLRKAVLRTLRLRGTKGLTSENIGIQLDFEISNVLVVPPE